ncbi:MAG TPA: hypothetical protein VHE54_11890, partial [Puia sp.]|nr:hypothetical protein [Puia sp.]
MIKLSLFLLSAGIFAPVLLTAQAEQIDTAMVNRLRQEEAMNSQIANISHQLTDVTGPRLTNSPGWHRAADWIVQTVKGWGLVRAQKEAWGEYGYGWSAEKTTLALRTPYYSPLIGYAVPWSGSTHGSLTAPVFVVQKMDSAWIAAHLAQMKGKILLIVPQDTTVSERFKPDAERYTDSALAAIGDMYMLSPAMLKMYIPIFT